MPLKHDQDAVVAVLAVVLVLTDGLAEAETNSRVRK